MRCLLLAIIAAAAIDGNSQAGEDDADYAADMIVSITNHNDANNSNF
jgi:hypothetical protein